MLNRVGGQFRRHRRDVLDDLGELDGEDGDADFEARRLAHAIFSPRGHGTAQETRRRYIDDPVRTVVLNALATFCAHANEKMPPFAPVTRMPLTVAAESNGSSPARTWLSPKIGRAHV